MTARRNAVAHTLLAATLISTALAACTVGPNYQGPPPTAPIAEQAGGVHRAALAGADNAPPATRWWEALQDPELDRLIDAALADSPDLHAAEARLRQARAALHQQRRNELPSASGTALFLHTNLPNISQGGGTGSGIGGDLNFYDAGF